MGEGCIMNRMGKATEKYANYWNIETWHEWTHTSEETEVNILEALFTELDKDIDSAKELRKLNEEQVYCEVLDKEEDKLPTRWVITTKLNKGRVAIKARLMVRGYENGMWSDSPTCMKENITNVNHIG